MKEVRRKKGRVQSFRVLGSTLVPLVVGLAVVGAREVVHKTGGEAAAPRFVEAGPRRRRYDGEEYERPHPAAAAHAATYLLANECVYSLDHARFALWALLGPMLACHRKYGASMP